MTTNGMPYITSQERRVLKLIAGGCTTKEIAKSLGITLGTVNTYRARLHRVFGVKSAIALINAARKERVLTSR